jgi:hypothetical protein
MKSGTTSMHHILDAHPDICIPRGEVFYFDIDDIHQHPDFFVELEDRWTFHDWKRGGEAYRTWYASHFASARADQVVGEDSTTYLCSERAPARIAAEAPAAKILIMLRDPASRTYSHYWHLVRTGRALFDFEETIQLTPGNLLQRSFYLPQVKRYLEHFPPEHVKVVTFEDFVARPAEIVRDVCGFVGADPGRVDPGSVHAHHNRARIPRSCRLQLWRNRLLRRTALDAYATRLPEAGLEGTRGVRGRTGRPVSRWLDKLHRVVNPSRPGATPPMKPSTRHFLNELFVRANEGLDVLLGIDLDRYWYRDG